MTNSAAGGIVFLTLIADKKQKDELLEALTDAGGLLINTIYGRGTVKSSYLMELFGWIAEEKKIVITCLLSREKAEFILGMLIDRFDFDKPNTGIAFTVPVDKLSL